VTSYSIFGKFVKPHFEFVAFFGIAPEKVAFVVLLDHPP
jgi:hypothetical protein